MNLIHDYESTTILSKRFQIFIFNTKKFFAKLFVNSTRQFFANSFVIVIFVERNFVIVISRKFFDISFSFITSFRNSLTNDFILIIKILISIFNALTLISFSNLFANNFTSFINVLILTFFFDRSSRRFSRLLSTS